MRRRWEGRKDVRRRWEGRRDVKRRWKGVGRRWKRVGRKEGCEEEVEGGRNVRRDVR